MNTSRYREVTAGRKGGERLVLTLIAMQTEEGQESDVDSLALDSGMSAKQILRITAKLKDSGAIVVRGGTGRAPYTFSLRSEDILSSQANEDKKSAQGSQDIMSPHSQDKMSSQTVVKTKSPDEPPRSEDILSGTPLAPSKDENTSTEDAQPSVEAGADAPRRRRGAGGKSPPDSKAKHPAIQAVRALMERYPDKILWDDLIELIGDEPDTLRLHKCRKLWLKRTFNRNSTGWTDWYAPGVLEAKEAEYGSQQHGIARANGAVSNVSARTARQNRSAATIYRSAAERLERAERLRGGGEPTDS